MKIKTILNKLNYSIVEEKIQQEIYHQIDSTIITKIKKASIPEDDIMQIMQQTNKKEIQTIKITKALSAYSKQIKKNYTSKIIGPMELTFYNNVELLGKNLSKKNTKINSIWFIKIKNFSIEMPKENYSLWQYNHDIQKRILRNEVLVSLYLIPLAQFINYSYIKNEKI